MRPAAGLPIQGRPVRPAGAQGDRPLSLFIFVDALGWRIASRVPILEDLLPVRGPMASVLGYSSTCIPTILTGRLPREHGHFSFFHYDPARSPFRALGPLKALPRRLVDRGRVRRVLSRALQGALGYTGYFQLYSVPFEHLPLFDYGEKRDLYRRGGINGGVPTAFDVMADEGIPAWVSDWRAPEAASIDALKGALREGAPASFAWLYLADLDGILHAHGARSRQVEAKIRWYDAALRDLIATARDARGEVHVHLASDHGMADVEEICDLMGAVERLGLRFGRDYAAMYDATMARFWILDERARGPLTELLSREHRGRILTDEELQAHGCDFPDRRQGDLMFLLRSGVLLCPSFMGLKPVAGMHGYEPTHEDALALYATDAPRGPLPASLLDLKDLMVRDARAVHAQAAGMRGAA